MAASKSCACMHWVSFDPGRHLRDAVMGGAHEGVDASVISGIEYLHDRIGALKAHGLRARLFLGHVIDAKELVVAKEKSVHIRYLPNQPRFFAA